MRTDYPLPLAVIDGIPIYPVWGGDGEGGYSTAGDVLVNSTADGVDLNVVWADHAQILQAYNAERAAIAALLSYSTTLSAEAVPQTTEGAKFELASEYGVPHSTVAPTEALKLGLTFEDYDARTGFTWRFLREATQEQVDAALNEILAADNRLVNGLILQRLFSPTPDSNEFGVPCYGLWNGGGIVPPPYLGNTFSSSDSHYLANGGAIIDSGDVEFAIREVQAHGYGVSASSRLLLLVNPQEGEEVSMWRAGEPNGADPEATGAPLARHDFVPSAGAPAYLQPDNIVGEVAPSTFEGLPVAGSYGPAWVIQSSYIPADYFALVATEGPNALGNVVGFRQHIKPEYQGLRMIPGPSRYPLVDSFMARACGVGVRRRGAAFCCQITTGSTYVSPTIEL